jgi:manganese transport protein
MKSIYKKSLIFLASIGPGLFLVGYNIGTGSITTMASAGADHGMALTWTVLISCIFTFILIVVFGRFTLITGQTSLYSFKMHFGKEVAIFVLLSLVISEMISSIGVMAVMVQAVQEWSRPVTSSGNGFNTIILAALFAGTMIFLLFNGRYSLIEKILTVFVALMGLCFIITMFMVIPDPASVIKGLIPKVPGGVNSGVLVAGMIGTTMGGVIYVVRSITVKEKQWSLSNIKLERKDAFISSLLMFLLSISVMACAAGTLYPNGLHIENAIDMIKLLQPLAGRFAISLFVVGIVCAGLSSLFPHYMLVPLLLSDYNQEKLDFSKTRNKVIMVFYASLGLIVPIFGGRPVFVLIISQALTLVATPLILILMIILQNKKDLMGKYKASLTTNILLLITILFTLLMAVIGVVGMVS